MELGKQPAFLFYFILKFSFPIFTPDIDKKHDDGKSILSW